MINKAVSLSKKKNKQKKTKHADKSMGSMRVGSWKRDTGGLVSNECFIYGNYYTAFYKIKVDCVWFASLSNFPPRTTDLKNRVKRCGLCFRICQSQNIDHHYYMSRSSYLIIFVSMFIGHAVEEVSSN